MSLYQHVNPAISSLFLDYIIYLIDFYLVDFKNPAV